MKLKRLIRNNLSLMSYFILTYFDKGLYFILPMAVLYFTKDAATYNTVEYICSITNIIVPFLTFISCFSFYGYKEARDKTYFTESYLLFSNVTVLIIGIVCTGVFNVLAGIGIGALNGIAIYLTIRTTFYVFVQYINCYYRLIDKPIKSLLYSIFINMSSLVAMFAFHTLENDTITMACFFIPETLIIVFALVFVIRTIKMGRAIKNYFLYIIDSIKFAWPVVLNSTVVAFVANYGKVYAYNFLSDYEMYCLSFLLRIVMIIEMAHASLISFFSKDIYLKGFSKKFVATYSVIMTFTIVAVSGIMYIYNLVFADQYIPLNGTFLLILIYALLHMIGAVIEIDYGRRNKNVYIFVISSIACALYMLMIFVIGIKNIYSVSLYMVLYMLVYVSILIIVRRKVLCPKR